jgi:hypothetical protein
LKTRRKLEQPFDRFSPKNTKVSQMQRSLDRFSLENPRPVKCNDHGIGSHQKTPRLVRCKDHLLDSRWKVQGQSDTSITNNKQQLHFIFFLISQCIIYIKKKAQSASKYTRTTQSASSIQRKPKLQMPLGTQKVYKRAQKENPKQAKDQNQHPTETALVH